MHKRRRMKKIWELRENYRKELEKMGVADKKDLSELTVKELKGLAEEKGIVEFNKMKKQELIDAIQSVEELDRIVEEDSKVICEDKEVEKLFEETPEEEVEELVVEVNDEKVNEAFEEGISEEVVQAVADAIVEEAAEQNKEVEEVIKEIQEENKED